MGMLDGLLGQVIGGALGGGGGGAAANNPLGSILGSLASSMGGAAAAPAGAGGGGLGGMLGNVLGGLTGGNRTGSGTGSGTGSRVGGGMGGAASGIILAAVLAMLQKQGGIGAVLGKLRDSGMGQQADSWVGTGANMPVSGDDLHNALGSGAIGDLAAKLGIPAQQAGGMLSKVLPELVNQLTPQGALPDGHGDLLSKGLEVLKGLGHHA
jgi:uncharacterized protein YidB (DUF937 family)